MSFVNINLNKNKGKINFCEYFLHFISHWYVPGLKHFFDTFFLDFTFDIFLQINDDSEREIDFI